MEWALPFSWVFSFPCSKSRAIHQRCGLYRLWVLFPGKVVSQLLASTHEVEQTMGYYYRMARALYHHCCLRNMAPFLAVKRLQFCCDNSSAVFSINPGNSKTPHIVDFVRHVMLLSIQHNFTVRAHHVTGVSNEIADALSRFQMQCFRALAPDTNQNPCTNPPSLTTLWGRKSCSTLPGIWLRTQIGSTALGKNGFYNFALWTVS